MKRLSDVDINRVASQANGQAVQRYGCAHRLHLTLAEAFVKMHRLPIRFQRKIDPALGRKYSLHRKIFDPKKSFVTNIRKGVW